MDKNTEKLISKIVDAKIEQLSKKIDTLQSTVDRAITQLDSDRKDISDLKVYAKKSLAVSEGARDDIENQTQRVLGKVDEHLQPMPDVLADQVKDSIEGIKKKKWYQLFRKKGG